MSKKVIICLIIGLILIPVTARARDTQRVASTTDYYVDRVYDNNDVCYVLHSESSQNLNMECLKK